MLLTSSCMFDPLNFICSPKRVWPLSSSLVPVQFHDLVIFVRNGFILHAHFSVQAEEEMPFRRSLCLDLRTNFSRFFSSFCLVA
jgi:hypothetical protein